MGDLKVFEGEPSDAELAKEYRKQVEIALAAVCEAMNEAWSHGLRVDFQLGRDQQGRNFVQPVTISKIL